MENEHGMHQKITALLEFAATDDVTAFKDAIEKDGHGVDEVGFWYGRRVGSKKLSYEERTPLMIAAMFGSKGVLSYILETGHVDVNKACGSDLATALHCAVVGGSAKSPEVVKLLLDASADVNAVDANGNKPCDLIFSLSNSRKRLLQAMLEGADCIDESLEKAEKNGPRVSKDYPFDPSLPDIKNEIFGTDEFRMFTFKVKPCSRAYTHDWTVCPFVHPGESARRRDPRMYQYSCVPCPEFKKGSCIKGDACEYAHGVFESWLHPAQYRTRLCKDETKCARNVCFFAHKKEELRPLYAATGSALPSPMDPFSPPLTPSESSSHVGGTMWKTQNAVPTLQISRNNRLKSAFNARDSGLDIELLKLDNRRFMQQLMLEEMGGFSSPSKNSMPNSPAFGSFIQSSTGIQVHQNMNQKLQGYSSNFSTSNVIGSPVSQPFKLCNSELPSPVTPLDVDPFTFSVWGSPDRKSDWASSGDELNKLRESSSLGFQSSTSPLTMDTTKYDEPDVSWVNSLLKDALPMESAVYMEQEQMVA